MFELRCSEFELGCSESQRKMEWNVDSYSPTLVKTSCALELVPNQQHSKTGVGPR
jgi:hypothetical protein